MIVTTPDPDLANGFVLRPPLEGPLTLTDGRTIRVQEWHPHVLVNGLVTVTIVGILCRPEEPDGVRAPL